jgi:adenylate cyclase
MNNYFTPLTDAILNHDGTIDKYIGDSVMAFWNAPLDISDHQLKSAKAALMMRDALRVLNEDRAAHGQEQIAFGVGLHSGSCSVGNMGSSRRFDYSILGDAVNLTSRLEGASKILATDILSTGAIRDATPDLAWLDLGLVRVVGRTEPTQVFALAGDEKIARSLAFREWQGQHISMMDHYRNFNFEAAGHAAAQIEALIQAPWKGLYANFRHRCLFHVKDVEPTPAGPVLVLSHK